MVISMTGFGKVTNSYDEFDVTVEIKSVNSKYFDPSFKTPKNLSSLEIMLRTPLQTELIRGKIEVRIDTVMKATVKVPRLNEELMRVYNNILNKIRTENCPEDNIKIDHFLKMPDLIEFASDEHIEEELENKVTASVMQCTGMLTAMRQKEGAALELDILTRIENLGKCITLIENAKIDIFTYWRERFIKRMQDMEISNIDEERIVQEASIYGEKADITEEVTRLKCHLTQFVTIMKNEFPIGKKLDFLSQEIHRELNTIASKSTRVEIIGAVIEGKAEADRIREQIQNII